MSAGHKRSRGGIESAEVQKALENPQVQALLHRPYHLNRDYDLPYLAGYSQDGRTIYIDKDLPQALGADPHLEVHEHVEKSVIDGLGYKYDAAHEVATAAERRSVISAGFSWLKYSAALEPWIKAEEHQRIQHIPPDLDLTPYQGSPALLKHMQNAEVSGNDTVDVKPGEAN